MAEQQMRVGVGQFNVLTDEKLRYATQLGVTTIQMNNPLLPGATHWHAQDLRNLVLKCREYGCTLEAIENVPIHFYNEAMLGLPGRDAQIENYQKTIRAMAEAEIPILGFHWMPNSVWRTDHLAPTRGGAGATRFDMARVQQLSPKEGTLAFAPASDEWRRGMPMVADETEIVTADQLWANYVYFMKAVLPVAEEVGLNLALHPDDPPVPMLGGVARIFSAPDGFRRAYELNPESTSWGLDLCLGCCSEMPGGAANVREMIEFFAPKGMIHYIHFRDVQGEVPDFTECFIGDGNFDPAAIVRLLHRTGFSGFLLDDHVPHMDGDTDWNHRGRAHAIGYMQGLLRML